MGAPFPYRPPTRLRKHSRISVENFSVPIEVFSPDGSRSVIIDALVDTRNCFTCLPGSLLRKLGIEPVRRIESELADGSVVEYEVGQVKVKLQEIETTTVAIFGADSDLVKLGHLTLTGAMLTVDPAGTRLVPARFSRASHPVLIAAANPIRY